MFSKPLFATAFATLLLLSSAAASDWPQFLGPNRNGISPENDLATTWPADGPPVVWQKKIGSGWAGPAVANGKLILFHRVDNKETVDCLNAKTGDPVWHFDYATAYVDDFSFDDGPRAVPTIADGKIYTLGADGVLHCLNFADGKKIWRVDTRKDFSAGKGFFGLVCAPLVVGKVVMVSIGGEGAGIVGFDKDTGKVLWKATSDEAGYSSPVAATIQGQQYAFFFTRAGLTALEPADGKVFFEIPWRSRDNNSVNAAAPVVIGDIVFISASYETGAKALRVTGSKYKELWSNDDVLSTHYATSLHKDGFLYGLDGRHDYPAGTTLKCVELATGKMRWQKPGLKGANLIMAGDQLLLLTERGQLDRIAASPDGFKLLSQAQILPSGVRAYPALADGLFYARSKDRLVCVKLGK